MTWCVCGWQWSQTQVNVFDAEYHTFPMFDLTACNVALLGA
jgi:hypothetical protein